ncbi:MAG: hypothetical protein RLZZ324_250 [Candidatus Parcubacteria bacterium]
MTRTRNQRRAFGRFIMKHFPEGWRLTRFADGHAVIGNWLSRAFVGTPPVAPQPQHLPLKHTRLADLEHAGFNVADHRAWLRGELDEPALEAFLRQHGSISLRNFREETPGEPTPKLPVEYEQTDWHHVREFCREYNRQYHTLVNQALPLGESLYAGNVILMDDARYVVSYFQGYGTPRDVDATPNGKLNVFMRSFGDAPPHVPEGLRDIGERFKTFLPQHRPMTIEFSIYPHAVGRLRRPEIFWEWRGGSTQDLHTVIARLLDRVSAYDVALHVPALNKSRMQ